MDSIERSEETKTTCVLHMNHRRMRVEAYVLKIRQVDSSCSPEQLHLVPLPKAVSMITLHVQLEPSPQSIII